MSMRKERQAAFSPDEIRACLERVCAYKDFQASPKISRFLRFIVEAKLAGKASGLKAYTIGVEVFDRTPGFDPDTDTIVRVNAVRLRRMLAAYYQGAGRGDPLRISMPNGSYAPVFAEPSAPEATPAGGRILLAVERLEWLGGPDGQDYLAVGLTDELVTTLSGYGDNLTVVRAPADAPGMAAGFESLPDCLAYQLLGSVRREGDDIRICIKLVEAAGGLVAWSKTFAHRLSSANLLAILEQVACKVAATVLDPHGILYQSLKRKTAPLLGSYLAVFRYHEYQERFAPETHLQAREALEQSVREDPGYADAWAALANVYLGEALFGFNQTSPLPVLVSKCYETAQKAVAIEPRNVMANYILAMALFYRKDKAQFLAAAQHTLHLAPHRPDNLAVIGMHLALAGQWERGLTLVTEAMHLNPFHPPWHHLVISLYHIHFGQYPAALAAIGRFAGIHFFPFQANLAVIHGHLGNLPEARLCLERMFELWPDARHRLQEILDFWFPFEDVADVFAAGLTKAGFSKATADLVETIQPALRGDRFVSPAVVQDQAVAPGRGATLDKRTLTDRERDVLRLLTEGQRTREIAAMLGISTKTVETYRSRLMLKLGIDNLPGLVKFALRAGITSSSA